MSPVALALPVMCRGRLCVLHRYVFSQEITRALPMDRGNESATAVLARNGSNPAAQKLPAHLDPQTHTPAQFNAQRIYAPYFARLIGVLKGVVTYSQEYDRWNDEKKEDVKSYRHYASDAMLDATYVVGPRTALGLIFEQMGKDFNHYMQNPRTVCNTAPHTAHTAPDLTVTPDSVLTIGPIPAFSAPPLPYVRCRSRLVPSELARYGGVSVLRAVSCADCRP
jgi:hypothetical protein